MSLRSRMREERLATRRRDASIVPLATFVFVLVAEVSSFSSPFRLCGGSTIRSANRFHRQWLYQQPDGGRDIAGGRAVFRWRSESPCNSSAARPIWRPLRSSYAKMQNDEHAGTETHHHAEAGSAASPPSPTLVEIDVRYGLKSELIYDHSLGRFVSMDEHDHFHAHPTGGYATNVGSGNKVDPVAGANGMKKLINLPRKLRRRIRKRFWPYVRSAFLPEGVSDDYYNFMRWRIIQRYINANVHVFGTQSLLLGLGIKERNSLGLSAALNWVLKDALGKITRMLWATRMGRKFDSDAKRWRFRSSLLFAAGNGLEVVTYVNPGLFLVWATLANCMKQMSMLTSSATRNALYNSFREGKRENIGDITAKGEAQIAVVDLLGITSGVCLSRAIGASVRNVLGVYAILQLLEVSCMYQEIRAVVFKMLNLERLLGMAEQLVESYPLSTTDRRRREKHFSHGTPPASMMEAMERIPTPDEVAKTERIFLPPAHLSRRAIVFGSVGRAKLAPDEVEILLGDVFAGEKYFLVVGENVKYIQSRRHRRRIRRNAQRRKADVRAIDRHCDGSTRQELAREHCHVVLHADASNLDIVKSVLAIACLRRNLADAVVDEQGAQMGGLVKPDAWRSKDCMQYIRSAKEEADILFPVFLKILQTKGWNLSRYMFGSVSMRAEWPLSPRKKVNITVAAPGARKNNTTALQLSSESRSDTQFLNETHTSGEVGGHSTALGTNAAINT